ncbi:hypothetical protein KC19_3G157100 [Ceratodon purpureus]|uniref:Uncharacterized protein n=1 Tax=Ceratodon purpureus TaxID=3225 RepID=A0A8T0ILB0_CERPU|nr:hypothetical protein KC19_3G157100 [Ceratodon purpureus]
MEFGRVGRGKGAADMQLCSNMKTIWRLLQWNVLCCAYVFPSVNHVVSNYYFSDFEQVIII